MIDLIGVFRRFCEDYNITFVTETPKGINIDADQLLKNDTLLWLNVIESDSVGVDTYGQRVEVERNIEVVFFRECNLEDDGSRYYDKLTELRNLSVELYKYLIKVDNSDGSVSNFLCENGVDQLDHNCIMQLVRFTITEYKDFCE